MFASTFPFSLFWCVVFPANERTKTIQLRAIQYILKGHQFLVSVFVLICRMEFCASLNEHFPENIIHFEVWIQSQIHIICMDGCSGGCIIAHKLSRPRVNVRIKSTYPVMFVMIFDSILLVGILKRRTTMMHSWLMNISDR